jgi:protein-S-isoprenylcysteine O-methyltransferase Ste14
MRARIFRLPGMTRVLSLAAYAAFLAVFVYFMGFVAGIGVPRSVDDGASAPWAAAIDLALVAFFGVVHSVMARAWFKRAWTRAVPAAAERSVYVLVASAQMALLCWQWRPLGPTLWSTSGALALALRAVEALGFVTLVGATFFIDHFELFGLKQGFGRASSAPALRTPFLYRWVRHPMYLGLLVGLWVSSTMTAGHLLLAASMTAYILIGVRHEERDLVRAFGDDYRTYQARVGCLLPRLPQVFQRVGRAGV